MALLTACCWPEGLTPAIRFSCSSVPPASTFCSTRCPVAVSAGNTHSNVVDGCISQRIISRDNGISNARLAPPLESVSKLDQGLQSFRSMRRMEASFKNARALRLRFSQSLAQSLSPSRQGLGKSQPQRPRVLETCLHPPHAAKAL